MCCVCVCVCIKHYRRKKIGGKNSVDVLKNILDLVDDMIND